MRFWRSETSNVLSQIARQMAYPSRVSVPASHVDDNRSFTRSTSNKRSGGAGLSVRESDHEPIAARGGASVSADPAHLIHISGLDVLPGIVILYFILLFNPGFHVSPYPWLVTSTEDGFRVADLCIPSFYLLIGIGTYMVHRASEGKGEGVWPLFGRSLWRAFYIFAVGLISNMFPFQSWSTLHVYGILERLGLCLGLSGFLFAITHEGRRRTLVFASALAISLVGYWAILRFAPFPGEEHVRRMLTAINPADTYGAWLDRSLFAGHLLDGSYDPWGLLGTIPAFGTVIMGVLVGIWLEQPYSKLRKAGGVLLAGGVALLLGGCWKCAFALNYPVWTSSFALLAGGMTLSAVFVLYTLCDVAGWTGKAWLPFMIFGKNPIATAFLAIFLSTLARTVAFHGETLSQIVYSHCLPGVESSHIRSLCYSLVICVLCWTGMGILYRRNVFLNL